MNIKYDLHNIHAYDAPYNDKNLFIERAQGVYMYDKNNTPYLDAISSWWSTSFGHANPEITQAIVNQAQKLPHVMFAGLTHEPALKLTESLINLLGDNFDQYFYSDSGSVAVEVALKIAVQYQVVQGKKERRKFLALANGYHGDTWKTMMVSEPDGYLHQVFSDKNTSGTYFLPVPDKLDFNSHVLNPDGSFSALSDEEFYNSPFGQTLVKYLEEHEHEIAALICEPMIQGAGGFYFYDLRYINKAIELCHTRDILVIFDEIATGFGRTSKDFAFETISNSPDIITLGKVLTGGHIGLGVTGFSKNIAQVIKNNPPYAFLHGPTFMGNPIATAAARAAVDFYWQHYSHKNPKAQAIQDIFYPSYANLKAKLKQLKREDIQDIRYLGPIFCLEFKQTLNKKEVQDYFIEHNIWLRPFGNILYIMPPYIITQEQLTTLCEQIYHFVANTNSSSNQKVVSQDNFV